MSGLSDSFQRPINYLRISVTDRCNLRCVYCMPPEGVPLMPRDSLLTYEEIHCVVQVAAELGISKVRLTGGEPLVRSGLPDLIHMLSQIKGIDDVSLTTNGVLLKQYAVVLKEAGLRRVNISLDSLKQDTFQAITRRDRLDDVLQGIASAHAAGLEPVKINMVMLRGINEAEVIDFARLTKDEGWNVRFIELMPFQGTKAQANAFVSAEEIKQLLTPLGEPEPGLLQVGNGPAKYFHFPGATGTIGFITPISEHFCFGCNRLRLSADGKLFPCLLSDNYIDLREPLRRGESGEKLKQLFQQAALSKPRGHQLAQGITPGRTMAQIGG